MDGHSVHPDDVRCDEPVSPAHRIHTAIRPLRSHMLFHVDSQGEELPADDHQRSGHDTVHHGFDPTFWLTAHIKDSIINTYKHTGATMKQLLKVKVGMIAVIAGIVGAGFGVGGVENSETTEQLIASIGVAVTSLMLMYLGTLMVREEI